jgi:protein involved in sex pheromone biosynthesis
MAKLLTVIIVSLSLLLGSCATRVQSKADGNAKVEDKHEKMSMEELQRELIAMQRVYAVAIREYMKARTKRMRAKTTYNGASEREDGGVDALFKKLEAEASEALAKEAYKKISDDFMVVQRAYIKLLMNAERAN